MTITQRLLDISPRPAIRLSEIERLIRAHRIVSPPISREQLRKMCEDGTFETAPRPTERHPFLVYEDSFLDWVRMLSGKTG